MRNINAPNIAGSMEKVLQPEQMNLLKHASLVSNESIDIYLVGGTVRDILLLQPPRDIDLMFTGDNQNAPEKICSSMKAKFIQRSEFGTWKLQKNDLVIDLSVSRKESYSYPGALPDVISGNFEEDLARRDFSINAMAVSLNHDSWGNLLDPFNGDRDIRKRIIRVLHPKSFMDDATRILRAIRYAKRMGFKLENETEEILRRDIQQLNTIGSDRVRNELQLIFREGMVAQILEYAQKLGVLLGIHPNIKLEYSTLLKLQTAPVLPICESELRTLACFVFSCTNNSVTSLIERLNMNSTWSKICRDVVQLRQLFGVLSQQEISKSKVHAILNHIHPAAIKGCIISAQNHGVVHTLQMYLNELRYVKPILTGHDLISLGLPKGPLIGNMLENLLKAKLDGLLPSKAKEEIFVKKHLS